jgi:23S rRNA C2498 (ribose-2'-O)-methylase RlmM
MTAPHIFGTYIFPFVHILESCNHWICSLWFTAADTKSSQYLEEQYKQFYVAMQIRLEQRMAHEETAKADIYIYFIRFKLLLNYARLPE